MIVGKSTEPVLTSTYCLTKRCAPPRWPSVPYPNLCAAAAVCCLCPCVCPVLLLASVCLSVCAPAYDCVYLQPCGSGVLTGGHAPHVNSLFTDFRLTCNVKLVQSEMHSGIAVWGEVPPLQHGEDHTYAGHLVMFPSSWSLVRSGCLFLARPH